MTITSTLATAGSYREQVRALIDQHVDPSWPGIGSLPVDAQREFLEGWRGFLVHHGLRAPLWPKKYGGGGLTNLEQAVIAEEFTRRGLPYVLTENDVSSFQLLGNLLLEHGTQEQRDHFLPRVISGDDLWCQGFSEPQAGSDLAAVVSHARLDGGRWVINGRKIWTSGAHLANWIFALVRTEDEAPRYRNLSMLMIPMDQPGVDARPIRQMNGEANFNEVTFTDAITSAEHVIGDRGDGWRVAMSTLGYERGESANLLALRMQFEFDMLVAHIREHRLDRSASTRTRLAVLHRRLQTVRHLAMRTTWSFIQGELPGDESSITKLLWSEYWQDVTEFAVDLFGTSSLVPSEFQTLFADGPEPLGTPNTSGAWMTSYLSSFPATIAAGTSEVIRNVIAERVLGLPR